MHISRQYAANLGDLAKTLIQLQQSKDFRGIQTLSRMVKILVIRPFQAKFILYAILNFNTIKKEEQSCHSYLLPRYPTHHFALYGGPQMPHDAPNPRLAVSQAFTNYLHGNELQKRI